MGLTGLEPNGATGMDRSHLGVSVKPGGAESGAESARSDSRGSRRLSLIADLLIGLPAEHRAEVILGLTPVERGEIAQLLIAAERSEEGSKR